MIGLTTVGWAGSCAAAGDPIDSVPTWLLLVVGPLLLLSPLVIALLIFLRHLRTWLVAKANGLGLSPLDIVGMSLRRVDPKTMVEALVVTRAAGLNVPRFDLEAHYLASPEAGKENVSRLARSIVMAHQGGIEVPHRALAAHQLAGGDIERVVMALIGAKHVGLEASFEQIAAHDLLGNDVLKVVKEGAERGEIEILKPEEGGTWCQNSW